MSAARDQDELTETADRAPDLVLAAVRRARERRGSEAPRPAAATVPTGYRAARRRAADASATLPGFGAPSGVEIDPEAGPVVSWAFQAFGAQDVDLAGLVESLAQRGVTLGPRAGSRPLTSAHVVRLLRNPYYLGTGTGPADRPALTDQLTFERVQRRLAADGGPSRHYLDQSLRCGHCGKPLRVRRLARRGAGTPWLTCPRTECEQQPVTLNLVELLVAEHYRSVELADDVRAEVDTDLDASAGDLHQTYLAAAPHGRRELNQALFAQLTFTDDGRVTSTPTEPAVTRARLEPVTDEEIWALETSPDDALELSVPAPAPADVFAPPSAAEVAPLPAELVPEAPSPVTRHGRLRRPTSLVLGCVVLVLWAAIIYASSIVDPSHSVQRVALFFHLAALVAGFGAVLFVDWHGLLFLARRRTHRDVVSVVCTAHPLVWSGLALLVASGVFLRPNLSAPLTWVKLALVLLLAINGLVAAEISTRLRDLGDRLPASRLLMIGGVVAFISQASWWGSTLIGFLNATA